MAAFLRWLGFANPPKNAAEETASEPLAAGFAALEKRLSSIEDSLVNVQQQLEAANNLQLFFLTGELLPPLHGWPISPDFAVHLIRLLQEQTYDCVLEFGSGSSTLILAKALQLLRRHATLHAVFEHNPDYCAKTKSLVAAAAHKAPRFFQTPLVPWTEGDMQYSYYDCASALASVAECLAHLPAYSVLAVVDGPPGATCKYARYPVLSHILAAFPGMGALDLLLDDADRDDETWCGKAWEKNLTDLGWSVVTRKLPAEKGALLLRSHTRT